MFVIEFRSGSYWHYTTGRTGKGVGYGEASRFFSQEGADEEARQWSLAGAMVVPYVERSKDAAD